MSVKNGNKQARKKKVDRHGIDRCVGLASVEIANKSREFIEKK